MKNISINTDTIEMQPGNDYDSPWKEALERYFSQFMALLFPQAHADIDWTLPHEFLDTELQQIVRDAESGRKHTDKLIKVFTRDGAEIWVLIHIEIQGRADKHFNERMYRYYYRLQDRHPDRQIASFAVLTNQRGGKTIGHYQQSLWHTFRHPDLYSKLPFNNVNKKSKKSDRYHHKTEKSR